MFDADDRRIVATAGVCLAALMAGALSVALSLGLAIRVFVWASGI